MLYLICYDWLSTRGNHAGMSHLCDMLTASCPNEIVAIKNYQLRNSRLFPYKRINRKIDFYRVRIQDKLFEAKFAKLLNQLKDGDIVLLMEYLHPMADQAIFAKRIKQYNNNVRVVGLAHLTPSALQELDVAAHTIDYWSNNVDVIMTLGHSLSDWLVEQGVNKNKVITALHYVDANYYHRTIPIRTDKLRVICMGNLQRNYEVLEEIVRKSPQVEFTICSGNFSLPQFEKYKNVRLLGYVSENQLRKEMENSNVSLNVLYDTVGSNVITTSMAMGLAMVVSDVGSIRDYCDETNAVFCNNVDDFVKALQCINVSELSKASIEKVAMLSITSFIKLLA